MQRAQLRALTQRWHKLIISHVSAACQNAHCAGRTRDATCNPTARTGMAQQGQGCGPQATQPCRMGATLSQGNPGTISSQQPGSSLAGFTKRLGCGQGRCRHFQLGLAGGKTKNKVCCAFAILGERTPSSRAGKGVLWQIAQRSCWPHETQDTCLLTTKPGSLETKSQRNKESLNLSQLISQL